jgi:catechol 2,3-dioxygenase-like lactoylglutathione lyase family enzyme
MINGAHAIIYSKDADADRAFFRDVLKFPNVDVGGGWLIFGLPPSEVAVHPGEANDEHEFYLMCDDIDAFIADMKTRQVKCGPIHEERWGRLTQVTLPGGGNLGVYQPKHPRPKSIER